MVITAAKGILNDLRFVGKEDKEKPKMTAAASLSP
jgi:hypothetical protein